MTDPVPSKELAESLRRLAGWSMWTHPREPDAERRSDVRNLHAAYEDNLNKLEELHDAHDTLERENDRLRTALRGIQSCSTCEACRGAATLALGGVETFACIGNCGASVPGPNAYCSACFLKARRPAHAREMPHCSTCSCPPYEPEPVRGVDLVTKHDHGYAEGYSDAVRWQPIETAPVQMDPILMTDGQWFAAGHVDPDGGTRKFRIYHFAVSQEYDWTPTHWMPLPTGPSRASAECPRSPSYGDPVPMAECIDNERCTCGAAQPPGDVRSVDCPACGKPMSEHKGDLKPGAVLWCP